MNTPEPWQLPGSQNPQGPPIPQPSAALHSWLTKPLGMQLLDLEAARVNAFADKLFGYEALLIGEQAMLGCLNNCSIKNKYVVNANIAVDPDRENILISRQDKLAIGSSLVDVVYLAHCLEFTNNPHEILREASRVLRADGHLIISMFNPFSMWGVWRSVAKLSHNVPWNANFISVVKLKDWLALLGFDIMRVNYFGFNLPLNKCHYVPNQKPSFLERCGQKFDLPIGGAYVIEASKRILPLTPITPAWHVKTGIIEDDVAEPTA